MCRVSIQETCYLIAFDLSINKLVVYYNLYLWYHMVFEFRTSGAGMPRNSLMSGFGGTEKIKDTRPLHDKSFVQQCIRQLHEVQTFYCFWYIHVHLLHALHPWCGIGNDWLLPQCVCFLLHIVDISSTCYIIYRCDTLTW